MSHGSSGFSGGARRPEHASTTDPSQGPRDDKARATQLVISDIRWEIVPFSFVSLDPLIAEWFGITLDELGRLYKEFDCD